MGKVSLLMDFINYSVEWIKEQCILLSVVAEYFQNYIVGDIFEPTAFTSVVFHAELNEYGTGVLWDWCNSSI